MRGADTFTEGLFTLKKLDDLVPTNHPLRLIRTMANKALTMLTNRLRYAESRRRATSRITAVNSLAPCL